MFDKFEPFRKLDKTKNFTFSPTRYETWFGVKMIDSGQTKLPVYFVPIQEDGEQRVRVMLFDDKITDQVQNNSEFDELVSSNDRLQLVILPAKTGTGCMGISALKMALGPTRDRKEFGRNDPYCCNLFLMNDKLVKVSFVFSNPERMVELYS